MKPIRYVCQGDDTGYGIAASALVAALVEGGADVIYEPLSLGPGFGLGYEPDKSGSAGAPDLQFLRDDGRSSTQTILHLVPEYYPWFLERERARGTKFVWGHAIWETSRLPRHWPDLINLLDGLIVPTAWNRQIFRQSGVRVPIEVIPHVPRRAQMVTDADRKRIDDIVVKLGSRFIFYTIGAWLQRKGFEPLIAAFAEAFGQKDQVALLIKTTPFDLERGSPVGPQLRGMIRSATRRHLRKMPPIELLTEQLTAGEMAALHDRCDCFVSLCRAEGWGLGAFEAASLGKPVIVTGWGGPLAFLKPETSFLVEYVETCVSPAVANASYTPDQRWAEPKTLSALYALRRVARETDMARERGRLARHDIQGRFNPGSVAASAMNILGLE